MVKNGSKVIIGQVGIGRWGKNLLRNYLSLPDCLVKYGCESHPGLLARLAGENPQVEFIAEPSRLLEDKEVEAVVIATPAPDHYKVAKQCLEKDKHVFVEKPITLDLNEARDLIQTAKEHNRKLMVGHLLLYHPAITKLKDLIEQGELGEIFYIYTQRLNLGVIRNTENVIWSLAPHDISIILHLINTDPVSVSATGASFIQNDIEDVAFMNIRFKSGEIGNVHVSWLDPTKTRRMIVVGSKKMAIFDEMASRSTLFVIDKGVDKNLEFKTYEEFLKLRFGEESPIELTKEEPLRIECRHFIDCVRNEKEPLSNGENGLAVLKILSAAERSLKNGGKNELL